MFRATLCPSVQGGVTAGERVDYVTGVGSCAVGVCGLNDSRGGSTLLVLVPVTFSAENVNVSSRLCYDSFVMNIKDDRKVTHEEYLYFSCARVKPFFSPMLFKTQFCSGILRMVDVVSRSTA